MRVYEAIEKAGEIPIKRKGVITYHAIRVLDLPLWDEYNRLVSAAKSIQTKIEANAEGLDVTRDAIDMAVKQLQLLAPTITREDLVGIPLDQIKEMLTEAVKAAMGADSSVSVDIKKKQLDGPSESSVSVTEESPSQPLLVTEG